MSTQDDVTDVIKLEDVEKEPDVADDEAAKPPEDQSGMDDDYKLEPSQNAELTPSMVEIVSETEMLPSDEDTPKVLTTLVPAKKNAEEVDDEAIEVEGDEVETMEESHVDSDGHETIEVYTTDDKEYIIEMDDDFIVDEVEELDEDDMDQHVNIVRIEESVAPKSRPNVSEIAQMQLANLTRKKGRPPKKVSADKQVQVLESKVVNPPKCHNKSPITTFKTPVLIRNKGVMANNNVSVPIISRNSANGGRSFNQPIILNKDVKTNLAKQIQNRFKVTMDDKSPPAGQSSSKSAADELLELLEHSTDDDESNLDSVKTEESKEVDDYTVNDIEEAVAYHSSSKKVQMDKEREIQLAMEQMLSMPRNPKGRRPKNRDANKTTPPVDTVKTRDLVDSLVNEWSDDGSKSENDGHDEAKFDVTRKLVRKAVVTPAPKVKVEMPTSTFKRTRIIKKKIIWDPDAPETKISYASLVHNSPAAGSSTDITKKLPQSVTVKKVNVKKAVEPPKSPKDEDDEVPAGSKRRNTAPAATTTKKRSKSEVDKLMGDEGAANMVQSLAPAASTAPKMLKQTSIKSAFSPINKADAPMKGQRGKRAATKLSPPKGASGKKKNASGQWDYVYAERNEDAMIIRRRSNSSYSSTTSPRRLSIDLADITDEDESHNFKFAKPPQKRASRDNSSARDHSIVADIKGKFNKALINGTSNLASNVRRSSRAHLTGDSAPPPKMPKTERVDGGVETKKTGHKELKVEVNDKFVVITMTPRSTKLQNSLSVTLMNELADTLTDLQNDKSCNVVVITGSDGFCSGIDYSTLLQANNAKRLQATQEMGNSVLKLLESLIVFKKPLIAGVNGKCSGLGVMMLPLFDIVLSSSSSKFEVAYGKIGQLPEGINIIKVCGKVHPKAITDLFYLGETYSTAKALEYGLVTKVASGMEPFNDSLHKVAEKVASFSSQSLESMKTSLRCVQLLVDGRLEEELQLWRSHWNSVECQEYFKSQLHGE